MAGPGDQDKLTDDWTPPGGEGDALSADWAAMLETDASASAAAEGPDRVLNQDEIDSLKADVAALAQALSRLSAFAAAAGPRLASVDVNPMLVLPEGQGCYAADAVIEL